MKNIYDTLRKPKMNVSHGDAPKDTPTEGDEVEEAQSSIPLSDHCFPDAKEGEEVSGTIKGVFNMVDGKRMLSSPKIDGYAVQMTEGESNANDDLATPEPEKDEEAPTNMAEAASDFFSKK